MKFMNRSRLIFGLTSTLLILIAVTACASVSPSQTAYGPIDQSSFDVGYRETRIEDNRWRVEFIAGPDAERDEVEFLALRRAAELAQSFGYEWFRPVSRRYDETDGGDSPIAVGGSVGGSWGSRGGRGTHIGLHINVDRDNERRKTARLEIIAGNGPVPEDAYDVTRFNQPVEIISPDSK